MRIHLIAIGGAVMHNLALALQQNGHLVSGSDDEIYNPAQDRLEAAGLLPPSLGWHPERLSSDIDTVILGMHARADNPELLHAQALGLKVLSYPAFILEQARDKVRCVIAGSHGKTTTTAMIMHALRHAGRDFDYLVGAQLEGFETMVRLSDAPVIIIEGDEYLSSALDPVPKMVRYHPHHAVVTGIAWDHVNVFPTFEGYRKQFFHLLESIEPEGHVFWYAGDMDMQRLLAERPHWHFHSQPFDAYPATVKNGKTLLETEGEQFELQVFGEHNLLNARAAGLVCRQLGLSEKAFLTALSTFKGAAKRLQLLAQTDQSAAWLDFAHAPSKARATTKAVKALYPERPLVAALELHTFSSLNKDFLPEYRGVLAEADKAFVYFSPHTLAMKKMPALAPEEVAAAFAHPRLRVITAREELEAALGAIDWAGKNLLLMSSGTFNGLNARELALAMLVRKA